jgi:hypothetical protein
MRKIPWEAWAEQDACIVGIQKRLTAGKEGFRPTRGDAYLTSRIESGAIGFGSGIVEDRVVGLSTVFTVSKCGAVGSHNILQGTRCWICGELSIVQAHTIRMIFF